MTSVTPNKLPLTGCGANKEVAVAHPCAASSARRAEETPSTSSSGSKKMGKSINVSTKITPPGWYRSPNKKIASSKKFSASVSNKMNKKIASLKKFSASASDKKVKAASNIAPAVWHTNHHKMGIDDDWKWLKEGRKKQEEEGTLPKPGPPINPPIYLCYNCRKKWYMYKTIGIDPLYPHSSICYECRALVKEANKKVHDAEQLQLMHDFNLLLDEKHEFWSEYIADPNRSKLWEKEHQDDYDPEYQA